VDKKIVGYTRDWEIISDFSIGEAPFVTRLRVPGGWLVSGQDVIFLPDEKGEWVFKEEK